MTGWRVGYAVGNPEIITAMSNWQDKRLQIWQRYLNMHHWSPNWTARLCWNHAPSLWRTFEYHYPLLCQSQVLKLSSPKVAFYLFPNVKKAMEMKGLYRCDDLCNSYSRRSRTCLDYRSWIWAPENVRLSYATDLDTLKKEAIRRFASIYGKIKLRIFVFFRRRFFCNENLLIFL